MHPSGSYIKTALETIRFLLNDATLDAKYQNTFLVRNPLTQAIVDVWSRVAMTMDNPPVVRMQVDLVQNLEYYQLPPCVQSVVAFRKLNPDGAIEQDWRPRNENHPMGPGWILDGNTVRFNPYPVQAETWFLWYNPSAQIPIHFATDGASTGTTNVTEFTLSSAPELGNPCRFDNEVVGQIIRILSGTRWYERIISAFDVTTQKVTFRIPIPLLSASSSLTYELLPAGSYPVWHAASCLAAIEAGIGLKISGDHKANINQRYLASIKTARDNFSNLQLRTGKGVDRLTIDHPDLTVTFPSWFRGP